MNGISDDSGNDYSAETRYTVRVSRVSHAKGYAKQWSALNAPSAVLASAQWRQDLYKPMRDEEIAVGKLADQFDLNSPARFFQSRIAQACPSVSLQSLSNFFKASRVDPSTMSTSNSRKRSA